MSTPTEPQEVWAAVPPEYGEYWASSLGMIKSKTKIRKQGLTPRGYRQITIKTPSGPKTVRAHRLIALAFGIITDSDHVNHINGIKSDNRISNLERSNHADNVRHAYQNGLNRPLRGEAHGSSKLTYSQAESAIRMYSQGHGPTQIARQYFVSSTCIRWLVTGRAWKELDPLRDELGIKKRVKPPYTMKYYKETAHPRAPSRTEREDTAPEVGGKGGV